MCVCVCVYFFCLDIYEFCFMRLIVILWILPSHYTRRCSHDSPSRFLFSYLTLAHARTYEYNCAKHDYKRRNRRTGSRRKILERACVRGHRAIFLHLSVVAAAFRLARCRGRTIDTVIYCCCAMQRSRVIYNARDLSQRWDYHFCLPG